MRLARAQSAARATEDSDEEEDEGREEREEVARVRYKHALRKLAEEFPELELPAGLTMRPAAPPNDVKTTPDLSMARRL